MSLKYLFFLGLMKIITKFVSRFVLNVVRVHHLGVLVRNHWRFHHIDHSKNLAGGFTLEGLKSGWTRPQRSDTYHYISDFSASIYDTTQSLCGKYHVDVSHAESKQFLQKFEILDTSAICHTCELYLQQRNQNNSKKVALDKIRIPKKKKNHDFAIKKISCSEKSCSTLGVAFVSVSNPKAKHYCMIHNKRVQDTITKLEVTA